MVITFENFVHKAPRTQQNRETKILRPICEVGRPSFSVISSVLIQYINKIEPPKSSQKRSLSKFQRIKIVRKNFSSSDFLSHNFSAIFVELEMGFRLNIIWVIRISGGLWFILS